MAFIWSPKDPDEVLDYLHDWSARLGEEDAIDTAYVIIESGDITIDSQSFSDGLQTVWLSDGVVGQTVVLTLRIDTVAGRTYDEGIKLKIKKR